MKLRLVLEPNAILNTPCNPVTKFDLKLKQLAGLMMFNMYQWKGIGLSANQVGRPIQLFVMDTSRVTEGKKRYIVNPKIINYGSFFEKPEACLSFPGEMIKRQRPEEVTLEYQDLDGNVITETFLGLSAQVIMHETEHLRGITLHDDISNIYLDK